VARPHRDRLKTAAQLLRSDGHEEAALDVEAVIAPGGWTLIRESGPTQTDVVSLPLTMDRRLKERIVEAAQATGTVLSISAAEGCRAFLRDDDDRFVPPRVVQVRGSAGYSKTTLTVTLPESLRDEVRKALPAAISEAGYRITLSSIVIEWLLEELGVQRPLD
jgi:ATP-dependent Clp protease ATP-binding subunit ClpA